MTEDEIYRDAHEIDVMIGARLRERRKAKGLNQTELGQAIGVSFQQTQKHERGINRVSCSALIQMCRALECQPGDILNDLTGHDKSEPAPFENIMRNVSGSTYGLRLMHAIMALPSEDVRCLTEMAERLSKASKALRSAA